MKHHPFDADERLDLARRAALCDPHQSFGYLPKTVEEAANFIPHQWVLNAMDRAYIAGVASVEQSDSDLRKLCERIAAGFKQHGNVLTSDMNTLTNLLKGQK